RTHQLPPAPHEEPAVGNGEDAGDQHGPHHRFGGAHGKRARQEQQEGRKHHEHASGAEREEHLPTDDAHRQAQGADAAGPSTAGNKVIGKRRAEGHRTYGFTSRSSPSRRRRKGTSDRPKQGPVSHSPVTG